MDILMWSDEQAELALRCGTFAEYEAAGGDHPREAWRSKRQRMKRQAMVDHAKTVVGHQTIKAPATESDYRRLFDLIKQADQLKQDLSPTQESTEFHAPDDGLPIAIAFTGDWHIGATGVEYDRLEDDLKLIGNTPGLYPVAMGDHIEGVTLASKANSALFNGAFNEMDIQDGVMRMLTDHARGKWVAFMKGNHEGWMTRATGYSISEKQAQYLGAPFFCQGGGTIFAHVGTQRYVIAVTHNAKGNSRVNTSNAQRVTFDVWPQWENCDVIVCGHLHYNDLHIAPRKGGRCAYLRSGTAKTKDAYAADHGFVPEYGIPIAILMPDAKQVYAWRGDDFLEGVDHLLRLRERYRRRETRRTS